MRHSGAISTTVLFMIVFTSNFGANYGYFKAGIFTSNTHAREVSQERCPKVKAMRNFDITGMMGFWYIVQYYASSEELPEYGCMRCVLSMSPEEHHVTMNFTYDYSEDPLKEGLLGNITWIIPEFSAPAHWIHKEEFYEGVYNTYILDTDYISWALIMHCAEKNKSPRYLSALLLSRKPELSINVINFLREKLPRYDIDISFMFPISQDNCGD